MRKRISVFSVLILVVAANQAFSEMMVIDDFDADLTPYTKCVILTNSGDDEATSLGKTSYSLVDGELNFGSSVTNSKAYQTTFLRDDYSLDPGERLQVELTEINQATSSSGASFGLCVASEKYKTFGQPREDLLSIAVTDYISMQRLKAFRFNGTDFTEVYNQTANLSNLTGLYLERTDTNLYNLGYMTASGDVELLADLNYTGGGAAVGFYSDSRDNNALFVKADNLAISGEVVVPEPSALGLILSGLAIGFASRRRRDG